MPLNDLQVTTVSDREVLWWLHDAAGGDGLWVTAREIAAHLGDGMFSHERPHALLANRLGWLMRFGVVEREHKTDEQGSPMYRSDGKLIYTQRWRLTEMGEAFMRGSLTKNQQKDLEQMPSERFLALVETVANQYDGLYDAQKFLMRRAWRFGTKLR